MKSTLLFQFVYSLSINNNQDLPIWRHEHEVESLIIQLPTNFQPPPSSFRVPAEYEPVEAVVIGYKSYGIMLQEIARVVTTIANAQLWAVMGPISISGTNASRYKTFNYQLDSVWMSFYMLI